MPGLRRLHSREPVRVLDSGLHPARQRPRQPLKRGAGEGGRPSPEPRRVLRSIIPGSSPRRRAWRPG
ncbi:hypothetical protein F0U63_06070 [Cystobacter fuscus]|nr:hypothetical protein F0U63_06070 [Cystobacter fuscus]